MREYATPASLPAPTSGNLTDDVLAHVRQAPHTVLFRRALAGQWRDVTAAQFHAEVVAAAAGLLAAGIQAGDRVGLLARTRYEWTLVDYACWWVGAVTVPVYPSATPEQAKEILTASGATACVVETRTQAGWLRGDGTPALEHVWVLDDSGLDQLALAGAGIAADVLEARRAAVTPSDPATIIYTSGTTGQPKGCRLTHANFMVELGEATGALPELFDPPDACTLLFLPLAHVFARIIQVGCVRRGTALGHTSDIAGLSATMAEFRPTFVLSVPRVFEQVFNNASQQALITGRGRVFDGAVGTAIAYSRALDTGRPGLVLRARHRAYERLVYRPLRERLGGRVRHAISGGAPLGERLGHFFRGIGVPVLEGYGLTESTAALTVNTPQEHKVGTVGRPVPGTTARVADDGELLFRGGQVFDGYWRAEDATAQTLRDRLAAHRRPRRDRRRRVSSASPGASTRSW